MTTPYATPRYPRAPYSTPTSQSASRKVPRAPIYNPFDQFPESEFQSWIGDITGAIKAALGREDPRESIARTPERVEREEEPLEDSFADVKARRAAKGKEREVEVGDQEQPIVIDSDNEEEEEEVEDAARIIEYDEGSDSEQEDEGQQEEEGEEAILQVEEAEEAEEENDDESEEEEHESEEEEEDEAPELQTSGPEVIELLSDEEDEVVALPLRARHEEDAEDPEEDADGSEVSSDEEPETALAKPERQPVHEAVELEDEEVEEDEEENEPDGAVEGSEVGSDEEQEATIFKLERPLVHEAKAFEIEDEDEEAEAVVEQPGPTAAPEPEVLYSGFAEEENESDIVADVDHDQSEQRVDLPDPWTGPSTYAEDFYSGGDLLLERGDASNPHVLPAEEEDEIVEVSGPASEAQEVDYGESSIVAEEAQEVQLPDPWSGPRVYAEDYYAGGDIRESDLRTRVRSPSHLEPVEKELTEFLTPDIGTPETTSLNAIEPDQSATQAHETTPNNVLMDELYADLVDESSVRGGSIEAVLAPDLEAVDADPHSAVPSTADSPSPPKFTSHVDWNWPPAFPEGRMATRPGHLLSRDHHDDFVEIVEISDDEVESPASPTAAETLSVEEGAEASVADDSGEETQTNEDEERSEVPDVQELMTGSAVAFDSSREYSDQRTVDELYADIDAYIASAEQNLLAESESLDMQVPANAADDVFIRDFLAGPSVGIGDRNAAETTGSIAAEQQPKAEPTDAAVEAEQSVRDEEKVVEASSDDIHPEQITATAEYEVEEPVTEGRRTEEPADNLRAPSIITEELSDVEGGSAERDVDVREYAVSEPDSPVEVIENTDATLELEDFDDPTADAPEIEDTSEATQGEDTSAPHKEDIVEESGAFGHADALPMLMDITAPDLHERMLEPGVPMPVSADPTVPDPTSVAPSPGETETVTPAEVDASGASTSRDSSVSGRPSSRDRSPSGLFTADNSRAVTPKLRSSDLGDGPVESPLKQVVTAEQLSGVDEPDGASTDVDDAQYVAVDADAPQSPEPPTVIAEESDVASSQQALIDTVDRKRENGAAATSELDELNLEYPSDTEEQPAISGGEKQEIDVHINPDTSLDVDAEGDVDPDYVPEQHALAADLKVAYNAGVVVSEEPVADKVQRDDTLAILGTEVEVKEPSTNLPGASQETSKTLVASQDTLGDADDPFVDAAVPSPRDETQSQDDSQSTGSSDTRSLKRKREGSRLPPRVTRSMTLREHATDDWEPRRTIQRALKGKDRRAIDEVDEERENAESPPNDQAEGSDSVTASQSVVASRPTSRSSSVASAALTRGPSSPTSPTATGTQTYPQTDDVPRLIDAQEVMHHHHGRRVLQVAARMLTLGGRSTSQSTEPMQQSRAASSSHSQSRVPSPSPSRPQSRPPSLSVVVPPTRPTSPTLTPASASDSGASSILPPEPEAGPSTPPPVVQKPATATPPPPQPAVSGRLKIGNSPVTRSRCRFHKISLPREENGPRIYFVVPGCSLSDKELMKEEEIVDHGVPSFPQGTKLLADIDHLKLNPYMLGVLRQLVGVDLLREQEVFYLPQEGEEYAWKPKRQHKHTVSKAKLSARGRKSIGAPIQSAPDSNGIAESISAARAYSRAGSVSTVSSRQSRRGRASGRSSVAYSASVAGSDLSELSEDEEPPSKRRKTESGSSPPAEVEGDKEASASQASAVAPRRLSKRSKRLGKDASAYKPDPEDVVDVSDDESGPSTKRKKRGKQRGTKRSRSDEPTEETVVETAPPKRRRTRKKAIQEANGEDK